MPHVESLEDYFLAKLGKYDKRADKWARTPANGEEWYERAYDLYRADRYEEAAVAFRRAADEDYAAAKSLYNAAYNDYLKGSYDLALREFRAALAAGPVDLAAAHCDLGEGYIQSGRLAEAKREAIAALEIAPNFERAQDLLLKTVEARP